MTFGQLDLSNEEITEAYKDALRYRWLREQHNSDGRSFHVRTMCNEIPNDLDAAIDAAMQAYRPVKPAERNEYGDQIGLGQIGKK